jgi:Ser/Thr protein kinase RdoA (MazF antagonist)
MSDGHDFAALAREAAGHHRFGPDAAVTAFSVTENPTFRIEETGRRPVILRIYHPGNRSEVEIRSELAWMAALRDETAVGVPGVVRAAGDRDVLALHGPDGPVYAVAFSDAAGSELDDDSLPSAAAAVGEITARLHVHARGWEPPPWFTRPRWDLRTTLGGAPHWGPWQRGVLDAGQARQLERLDAVVRRRLAAWGEGPERFGLMHADLRMANVFADGEDLTIIDFDDAGYSWFLYDVGSMLTFCEGRADVDEIVASWADGYRRVAPLSADDEREIPTFLMLRRLLVHAYLGFRSDTDLAAEAHADGYGAESCVVAERYLSRFG